MFMTLTHWVTFNNYIQLSTQNPQTEESPQKPYTSTQHTQNKFISLDTMANCQLYHTATSDPMSMSSRTGFGTLWEAHMSMSGSDKEH